MQIESKEEHVTTTQDALQISTIVPSLTVDDLQKSLAFYEALGFSVDVHGASRCAAASATASAACATST